MNLSYVYAWSPKLLKSAYPLAQGGKGGGEEKSFLISNAFANYVGCACFKSRFLLSSSLRAVTVPREGEVCMHFPLNMTKKKGGVGGRKTQNFGLVVQKKSQMSIPRKRDKIICGGGGGKIIPVVFLSLEEGVCVNDSFILVPDKTFVLQNEGGS